MTKRFEEKVVLITGAAHGIGKQIALQFAQEGAKTVIVDYNEELGKETAAELTKDYQPSLFVKADVSSKEDLENVKKEVEKEFGLIDILILDAGIGIQATLDELKDEDWHKIININLTGLWNTVTCFYKDLVERKGSIVYISSGSAASGTGGASPYPAAKAGGEGFMRALAKELGPKGVNVNTIAPRLIDSGAMMRVNYPTQAELDAVLQKIPVRRFGTMEDVANLTLFLADKANSYIHGQTILLDGGRTVA